MVAHPDGLFAAFDEESNLKVIHCDSTPSLSG